MDPISKARRLHFATRVRERIGPDVDADGLARGLLAAIERDRTDLVAFVSRLHRDGRRLFRFRVRDGRWFFAVIDTDRGEAVTVIEPGSGCLTREGRPALQMEDE